MFFLRILILVRNFLFIPLITYFLSSQDIEEGKHVCSRSDKNNFEICTQESQTVCAYFSGRECQGECPKQTLNKCTACFDPNVIYYTEGKCKADKVYCDTYPSPSACTEEFDPVCGYYTENCPDGLCSKTIANQCFACQDNNMKYYTQGKCQNPTDYVCGTDEPFDKSFPVCSFFQEGCPYGLCERTYENSLAACMDFKTLFYRAGVCQHETISCDFIDIPVVCPKAYSPICASLRECKERNCVKTFDNICSACSESKYSLLKYGICEQDRVRCTSRPFMCTQDYNPVCSFYNGPCPGGVCFSTASNICAACSDKNIDYFISGACKEDRSQVEYCLPNNRPLGCPDDVNPVCAFKGIYCITTPCPSWEAYTNGCTACQDPAVVYHIPGECPQMKRR